MRGCLLPHSKLQSSCLIGSSKQRPLAPLLVRQSQQVVPTLQQQQQQRDMNTPAAVPAAVTAALAGISIGLLAAWVDAKLKSRKPDLYFTANEFNSAVLDRCPTVQSTYQCTAFLTNGHAETILVAKLRKAPGVVYRREILLTKDGGAVTVDWEHVGDDGKDLPEDAPVLILFPGLTGGSGDSYVQHAVLQARHAGVRAAVFNSRGTADSPVLTPQFYSASFTDDTREVIAHVRARYPSSTLFAAGWSLGANILVNYLGEQGPDTPLEAAVSMCNPFDLTISNRHINEGFNKIYNWNLASSLKRIFMRHQPLWRTYSGPGRPDLVPQVKTIREFDEAITVHSFDWADVDAYYAGSSSAKRIPKVCIPLLCIQAADDPIAPEEAIPYEAIKQNPNCTLVVTPCGGHLGWAAGAGAPFSEPWTDAAVVEWLTSVHAQLQQERGGKGQPGAAAAAVVAAAAAQQAADRARDGDDDGDGDNNGGSNGSNSSAAARELETVAAVAATAGRANSSSSAFTAATPILSRQHSSSSSSGSSSSNAFASPVDSPASSVPAAAAAPSRPGTAASTASSIGSVHSRRQSQQPQQREGSQPADLMEQLWWGQGQGQGQGRPPAAAHSTQQLQLSSRRQSAGSTSTAPAGRLASSSDAEQALVAAVAAEQPQQQPVRVSPFAAAAAAEEEEEQAGGVDEPAAAATPVVQRSGADIDAAERELWQSVRYAF